MEIRRFGIGHRRPEGPPGSHNIQGQVIHTDARGVVAELAFGRHAAVEMHSNPNTTYFVVIEGGGFVQVGDDRARVSAGEAVLWPAFVRHGAWTELSEMRAIVVEFGGADDAAARGILEGRALALGPGEFGESAQGEGQLADRPPKAEDHDRSEGEPF